MERDPESLHHRLCTLEDRASLVEGILDLPMGTRCRGNPGACGKSCTPTACPLSNNRLRAVGDLMTTLIEEIQWVRALIDEMEHAGKMGPSLKQRVEFRARKAKLEIEIGELEREQVLSAGVAVLSSLNETRLAKRRQELRDLNELLSRGTT